MFPLHKRNRDKSSDVQEAYTASPAYGEPYLADVDFGTSTSYSHLAFNTTGAWKIGLGLHQGGHQLSGGSLWS